MNLPFIRLAREWVGFAAILAGTHCCAEDVMPPARSNVVALLSSGVIPAAGAEAYREYALHSVLACAHAAAVKWGLETNLIAAGKVTSLEAKPFPDGSSDITVVFGDRYFFAAFSHEGRFLFRDLVYELKWALSATTYKQHTYAVELTRRGTNHLSLEKAQRIAATAVRSVGLAAAESAVANPSRAEQLTWRNGSTNYSLPCYGFQWESGLDGGCTVAVSGIISNVVLFDSESPRLRLPSPTNLVELLGLPAGTIFVKSRQLAYKWVEAQAMLAEVNFCAERLTLPMRLPIHRRDLRDLFVAVPDGGAVLGVTLDTSKYSFSCYVTERLRYITKFNPFGDTSVAQQNKLLNHSKSLISTNEAYAMATNWLTRISVDVVLLEKTNSVVAEQWCSGEGPDKHLQPVFDIFWGSKAEKKVMVTIDGRTRELVSLRMEDDSFSRKPAELIRDREKLLRISDEEFLAYNSVQRDALIPRFTAVRYLGE